MWRLDKWVEWIEASVELASKVEKKSSMEIRVLNRKLKDAKEIHDDMLLKYGINSLQTKTEYFSRAPDSQPSSPLFTSIYPYDEVKKVKEWQTLQNNCIYLQILPTDASVIEVFCLEIMISIQNFQKTYSTSQNQ